MSDGSGAAEPAPDPPRDPPREPPTAAGRPVEPTNDQVRAAFEEIVAGLGRPSPGAAGQSTPPGSPGAAPTVDESPGPRAPGGDLAPGGSGHPAPPPGWRVHEMAEPPEEHFTPPPPRPLPRDDAGFWLSLVGLVGGPCWLLYLLLADPHGSRVWRWVAGGLFVAGLVTMMCRAPREPRDPHDDGARV